MLTNAYQANWAKLNLNASKWTWIVIILVIITTSCYKTRLQQHLGIFKLTILLSQTEFFTRPEFWYTIINNIFQLILIKIILGMILMLLIILLLTVIYWYLAKHYNYWIKKSVKQRKQVYILGDNWKILLRQESFFEGVIRLYNTFPNER